MTINFTLDSLVIGSPKRKFRKKSEFFPYYAGFPESFAEDIIQSANIPSDSLVVDPWNGSGTTTFVAAQLGFDAIGIDINPVMALVAKARALPASEVDSIVPQAISICKGLGRVTCVDPADRLLQWFDPDTAKLIRGIERRIRERLISAACGTSLGKVSCLAATFYAALFVICKRFTLAFRTTNPTWLRVPKTTEKKIALNAGEVALAFVTESATLEHKFRSSTKMTAPGSTHISVGNSTETKLSAQADLVLTSPPYCTRIDYTAATRVELAIASHFVGDSLDQLSREMIGSVKVPSEEIRIETNWGVRAMNS